MAETLEFNDVYQEVKGSMVRRAPRREGSGPAGPLIMPMLCMGMLVWKRAQSTRVCLGFPPTEKRCPGKGPESGPLEGLTAAIPSPGAWKVRPCKGCGCLSQD